MTKEAAVELVRSEGEVKEPILPWVAVNAARLVIYLVIYGVLLPAGLASSSR
jgi:hypothetical protein